MIRIQRRRAKGWRMPAGAVYVGRPSKWGNPFNVTARNNREYAIERYRRMIAYDDRTWLSEVRKRWWAPIRDATALVCWCPLDQPCHADVLIELLA